MAQEVVELVDPAREQRPIDVHVFGPSSEVPVVVFCHGFNGHPRKFRTLLEGWTAAGFGVVAPVFPLTSDESVGETILEDVARQPADVRFVLDALADGGLGIAADMSRIGVGGFSLGGITALAIGFGRVERDERVRAIAAFAARAPEFDVLEPRPLPLLMAHGTEDEKVPYDAGRAVFEAAAEPKEWIELSGGAHHEVFEDGYERPAIVDERSAMFWQDALL